MRESTTTADEFRLKHQIRVRWAEVDQQSIVFNGHYFFYFDIATTEYWREIGFGYPEGFVRLNGDMFAVKAEAEFLAPAKFDDVLEVGCRILQIGRTSVHLLLAVFRDGKLLTRGNLIYVFTSLLDRQPTPIPTELKDAICEFEIVAPLIKSPQ